MKPTTLPFAIPLALSLLTNGASAQWPVYQNYTSCVTYCNQDYACQFAAWDTISGNCEYYDCVQGQSAPARFSTYLKPSATASYCSGTTPTATGAVQNTAGAGAGSAASSDGAASSTGVAAAAASATQTGGVASVGGRGEGADAVAVAAAVWVGMRLVVG